MERIRPFFVFVAQMLVTQVISLVVFVGYSVTYALHIAHNYNQAVFPGLESIGVWARSAN